MPEVVPARGYLVEDIYGHPIPFVTLSPQGEGAFIEREAPPLFSSLPDCPFTSSPQRIDLFVATTLILLNYLYPSREVYNEEIHQDNIRCNPGGGNDPAAEMPGGMHLLSYISIYTAELYPGVAGGTESQRV